MWEYNYTDELCHYGVKGMRWGVRRAQKYRNKANVARASAKEWDDMAGYAEQRGKHKLAAKYRNAANKDRTDADRYEKKAMKANTPLSEAEQYKRDQRTKDVVKGVLGTVGTLAVGAASAAAAVGTVGYIAYKGLGYVVNDLRP